MDATDLSLTATAGVVARIDSRIKKKLLKHGRSCNVGRSFTVDMSLVSPTTGDAPKQSFRGFRHLTTGDETRVVS
jgi:hypothetical protein